MREKINAGRLFAKALKNEGVECIFSLSGGHIMPIYYGCREEGIKVIDVRHEAVAAQAADAYARVTGKPGVVVTTAGPGVTNATTAMVETKMSGAPVIHIGGAAPIKESDSGTLQDVDSVNIMANCCKWSRKIYHGNRVPEYVSMAFRYAMSGTPGPVYIEIGTDTIQEIYDVDTIYFPEKYRTEEQPYGSPEAIKKAAELLAKAKKPVCVIGDSARFSSDDNGAVKELVNFLKMPVWIVNMARGLFADEDEPLFKMGFGVAEHADVVLELGARNDFMIAKGKYNENAKYIQVNVDAEMIGYNTPADVGIIGGTGAVAMQLIEELKNNYSAREDDVWYLKAKRINEKYIDVYTKGYKNRDMMPMHHGACASEVGKFLETEGRDWNIICDGGDSTHWIKNVARAHRPGQMLEKGPFGTIGSGAGFTLGAWAATGKPTLYYTGDGSFGFYAMDFDTYARFNVPVVCVIANDSQWGMIKMAETVRHPDEEPIGLDLVEGTRYDLMPQIWGGKGFLVTSPEEIIPAIKAIY